MGKTDEVIIVGAGPAGLAAAIQLKRYGIALRVFEKDALGGLLRNANLVENYPGFPGGIPGIELVRLFQAQADELGLEIGYQEVIELDYESGATMEPGMFRARTDRAEYAAPVAILASGTRPRQLASPATPPEVRDKILYEIHTLAGVKDKEIAILGAGDAAFDYALNLAKLNRVVILNRGATRRCLPLLWERAQDLPAVRYCADTAVTQIEAETPDRLRLECRQPAGSLTLHPHYLVAAFGRDPQLDYLTDNVRRLAQELESAGRLYFIGDVINGIYRQTSIAVGNGVQAAMEVYQNLTEQAA
jgi:thioredoxin reductase